MTRGTGLHLAALVLVLAAATGTPAADAPDDDLRVELFASVRSLADYVTRVSSRCAAPAV